MRAAWRWWSLWEIWIRSVLPRYPENRRLKWSTDSWNSAAYNKPNRYNLSLPRSSAWSSSWTICTAALSSKKKLKIAYWVLREIGSKQYPKSKTGPHRTWRRLSTNSETTMQRYWIRSRRNGRMSAMGGVTSNRRSGWHWRNLISARRGMLKEEVWSVNYSHFLISRTLGWSSWLWRVWLAPKTTTQNNKHSWRASWWSTRWIVRGICWTNKTAISWTPKRSRSSCRNPRSEPYKNIRSSSDLNNITSACGNKSMI